MRKRILIFIVSYNAERTISEVLSRIPERLFSDTRYEIELLLIDDCSADNTFEQAQSYRESHQSRPLTILYNPENQGYGGNQKIGYRYAIDNGFDYVVLLHGDGQYAPEELPRLLEPLLNGSCDVVFGSRMLPEGNPLKGGMPLYKFIGNKLLSFLQNKIVGTSLSEYHSGYRAYSCEALNIIPFENNANYFDFDTDIIIQIHGAGLRIKEIPISTHYGEEICYVNGLRYAKQILKSCIVYRLQRFGIFYDMKFDLEPTNEQYQSKSSFCSSHSLALDSVGISDSLLILGPGGAELIAPFADKTDAIDVLDLHINNSHRALCRNCYKGDIESFSFGNLDSEHYDKVLLLDIIEHLKYPEALLNKIRASNVFSKSEIIITTGNVAFFPIRIMLLFGFFNYGKRGILDKTHARLFTYSSIRYLLEQNGFELKTIKGIPTPFPLAVGYGPLGRLLLCLNRCLIVLSPSLFSYQIYCEARPLPTSKHLLADAVTASDHRLLNNG